MSCSTCDQLLLRCAEALVGAAEPVASFEASCDAVLFHGGRYGSDAYDRVADLLKRYPDAHVYIPAKGGTFEPKELKRSSHTAEAELHASELRRRQVKNRIETDPVATNTREEITWARDRLTDAGRLCALTTDIHALRLALTYVHAPALHPAFLRPGVWQVDLKEDRERVLQEIYRILLYGLVDNEKATDAAQELFYQTVDHMRSEHADEHAALLQEREEYIRAHFDVPDPLVRK